MALSSGALLMYALVMHEAYAENWTGTTGLRVSETYTDNIGRQPAGQKRSDWATEVSPYVSYAGQGARSSGSIDARLQNWFHADSQTSNRTGLQLNAVGNLEAYEDHLFIDSSLSNDRQQISQFRAADSSYGGNSNSTEVTRFSVSPNLVWRLGNATNASLRYRFEKVNSDQSFATGQSDSLSLNLKNGSAFGRLGWGFTASHFDVESDSSAASSTNDYSGTLSYAVTPELSASLSGGQEFTDFEGGRRQHSWNWGGGLQWQPDERTTIGAQTSKRFFGRGFSYSLSHRFQSSALEWSYARDLNVFSNTSSIGALSSSRYYTEYLAELEALKSSIPDETERKRVAIAHLAARGIPVFELTTLDYVSGQSSINKNMRLAWVIYGARNSVTLSAHRSERHSISENGFVQSGDDLATHQSIKEHGWDTTWTHDLSALTSMNLRYGYSSTSGVAKTGALTSTHSNNVGVSLNTKLAPYTTGGLSYNHIQSTGSAEYRENAVAVQLNHRF